MIITEEQNNARINIAKGMVFQVKLEARLSTGYSWELVSGATNVSLTDRPAVKTEEKDKTGGIDWQVFTFRADSAGETLLLFQYRRPWVDNEVPEKYFRLKVVVN